MLLCTYVRGGNTDRTNQPLQAAALNWHLFNMLKNPKMPPQEPLGDAHAALAVNALTQKRGLTHSAPMCVGVTPTAPTTRYERPHLLVPLDARKPPKCAQEPQVDAHAALAVNALTLYHTLPHHTQLTVTVQNATYR